MARRLCELAYYQTRLGENEASIQSQKRAIAIMEAVFKANPTVVANRNSLSWYSANLGYDLGTAGRTAEARPYLERSLHLIEEDVRSSAGAVPILYLATVKVRYGVVLSRGSQIAAAREKLEQALAHYDILMGDPKPTGISFKNIATDYTEAAVELAQIYGLQGDAARAAGLCRRAVQRAGELDARDSELAFQLGRAHSLLGQLRSQVLGNGDKTESAHTEMEFSMAVQLLGQAFTSGYRNIPYIGTDRVLDPLRERPDFRLLMMDLAFPADPFGTPR
jgi:tetratricopeptide (TPR) repeat protein